MIKTKLPKPQAKNAAELLYQGEGIRKCVDVLCSKAVYEQTMYGRAEIRIGENVLEYLNNQEEKE